MKDSLMMLANFLKNPRQTGSVAQSSKFLTREIVKNVDFKNSKCIVELGPGMGTFTKAVLNKARPDAMVVCFEVNKKFCSYLIKNFEDRRLIVVNAGADKIKDNLKKVNIKEADCIISGLPFRNFPDKYKKKILKEVRDSLSYNGRFILFQYTNNLRKMLKWYFIRVSRKFIPLNMPPAFVYVCEKQLK
ncbi:MAG TPA: rRNA adenine N-6-methyltransferase family protein [Candidatus Nanoarchaeia archaeon]|nr:rRNA adenine N-6-methyltransferase family protein [Candidatus Nanoarchaeia archaeon]